MMKVKFTLFVLLISVTYSFSQQTVGLFTNDSTSLNGYTLISPLFSNQIYLIDNCGFVVNEWNASPYRPAASVYLMDDGSIIRTGRTQDSTYAVGGSGGIIEKYSWDDVLLWSYTVSDAAQRQHHDIEIMPNGNILVIVFQGHTNAEAIQAGRDPSTLTDDVWSEKIIELQPIGVDSAVVVWEWNLWDHVIQDYDVNMDNYGVVRDYPELVDMNFSGLGGLTPDWIHANAIDYNSKRDEIIISARNYHEMWIIDHSTTTAEAAGHTGGNSGKGGDLLYRWGNPQTYDIGKPAQQILFGQHDTHWITEGYKDGGKIMVYNNVSGPLQDMSQVLIVEPPLDSIGNYFYEEDSIFLPKQAEWSYSTPNFCDFVSGVQRLENGNTLICDGCLGIVTEIDSFENVVWEYISPAESNGTVTDQTVAPQNNVLFRANRYAPEYPAFDGRDMTPGNPIELNPLPSTCQLYFPTTTISQNWGTLDLQVMGNPIHDELRIKNYSNSDLQLVIIDLSGKVILEDKTNKSTISYDASNWTKGNYFIIAINEENQQLFRQQIIKF